MRRFSYSLRFLFLILFQYGFSFSAEAKLVKYELTVARQAVNLSGKATVPFALTVNGSIPAPTLEFTEGDEAEITVVNTLDEEVSTHWHGILLPWTEDGVSYVNTKPILAGQRHTFRFPVRQHGTYWYHSHTALQEQKGLYGAIVIHPRKSKIAADHDVVAVLSDWSDEDGDQILRNLRKDGDFYLYKKDSMRSYLGAIAAGGLGTMLKNEWEGMGGMDLSDVGYDAFLVNGKRDSQLVVAHPGEEVRVRIVNAGASSYFYVSLAGLPFQVVSADGVDVQPTWARELLVGMAETYDILFTVPEHKNYELRATCQDVTGYASGWIGMGQKVKAPDKPQPDLYAAMDHGAHGGMDHSSHEQMDHSSRQQVDHSAHEQMDHSAHEGMDHSSHEGMDHSQHKRGTKPRTGHGEPGTENRKTVLSQLTVDHLRAESSTAFDKNAKTRELKLVLDGDMERYVWHINGKAIHEDRLILVEEGEVVRFVFENQSMMHHPMHLHGHFFRVVNEGGELSPLKHTVDVPPHGTRVIEFLANERGQWMLHCHNLYHMKNGMGRVIRYTSLRMTPEQQHLDHHDHHQHDHVYWDAGVLAASNMAEARFRLSRTWDHLELKGEGREHGREWELEGDVFYRRYFGAKLNLLGGYTSFEGHHRGTAGVGYTLPLLFEVQGLVDHKGDFRFDVERRFQWWKHVFTDAELTVRTKLNPEYTLTLMYGPSWHWAAGLVVTEEKLGGGLQVRF